MGPGAARDRRRRPTRSASTTSPCSTASTGSALKLGPAQIQDGSPPDPGLSRSTPPARRPAASGPVSVDRTAPKLKLDRRGSKVKVTIDDGSRNLIGPGLRLDQLRGRRPHRGHGEGRCRRQEDPPLLTRPASTAISVEAKDKAGNTAEKKLKVDGPMRLGTRARWARCSRPCRRPLGADRYRARDLRDRGGRIGRRPGLRRLPTARAGRRRDDVRAVSADGNYVVIQTRARNFFADDDADPDGKYRAGGLFRVRDRHPQPGKVADGDLFDEESNEFLRRGASNPSIIGRRPLRRIRDGRAAGARRRQRATSTSTFAT